MPKARRTRRRRGMSAWIEELGHVTLTRLWSVTIAALTLVVGTLWNAGARVGSWWCAQPIVVRVAALALPVVAAGLLLELAHTWSPPAFVPISEDEALARIIRSEIGIGTRQEQIHVAWATRNLAAQRGQSIVELACSPCGPQERGRPVSSVQEAQDADRELARAILASPDLLDPTGGATQFINPRLQDELARRGAPGYRGRSYRVVSRRWRESYGWEPYYRLSPILELWGRRRER